MFTVGIERRHAYVVATLSGPADVRTICSAAVFIAEVLRREAAARVLVDITAMDQKLARADALDVISTLYGCLPPLEKIAVLTVPGESRGMVLEVARHRNVPAREFATIEEAEAWLQQE